MKLSDIAQLRLRHQYIAPASTLTPAKIVAHMGAVQAQDYTAALWAVGLRGSGIQENDVEHALAEGEIIRLWPMRGTIHFVAADDVRWMHALMLPRMTNEYVRRQHVRGVSDAMLARSRTSLASALAGGVALSRPDCYAVLERAKVSTADGVGLHILNRLAHEQLICFGPRSGKQATMVLFDAWVPQGKFMASRDESLREIAVRYFTSHGPATVQDMAWWTGLTTKDVARGIEIAGRALERIDVGDASYWMVPLGNVQMPHDEGVHMLPPFDEYFVAYRNRDAVLESAHAHHVNPGGNGMLGATIVSGGQIIGTWKRSLTARSVRILPHYFTQKARQPARALQTVANAYGAFLGVPAELQGT